MEDQFKSNYDKHTDPKRAYSSFPELFRQLSDFSSVKHLFFTKAVVTPKISSRESDVRVEAVASLADAPVLGSKMAPTDTMNQNSMKTDIGALEVHTFGVYNDLKDPEWVSPKVSPPIMPNPLSQQAGLSCISATPHSHDSCQNRSKTVHEADTRAVQGQRVKAIYHEVPLHILAPDTPLKALHSSTREKADSGPDEQSSDDPNHLRTPPSVLEAISKDSSQTSLNSIDKRMGNVVEEEGSQKVCAIAAPRILIDETPSSTYDPRDGIISPTPSLRDLIEEDDPLSAILDLENTFTPLPPNMIRSISNEESKIPVRRQSSLIQRPSSLSNPTQMIDQPHPFLGLSPN